MALLSRFTSPGRSLNYSISHMKIINRFTFGVLYALMVSVCITSTFAENIHIHPGAGTRQWLGPSIWANPMHDWSVEEGRIVAIAGQDRTAHVIGKYITEQTLQDTFEMSVMVNLVQRIQLAGFRIGVKGNTGEHRSALVHHQSGVSVGIDAQGKLHIGDTHSASSIRPINAEVRLTVRLSPGQSANTINVELTAKDKAGTSEALAVEIPRRQLLGNIALLAEAPFAGPSKAASLKTRPRVVFDQWEIIAPSIGSKDDMLFGPVLWSQYTLSNDVLTVSAQMPPMGQEDSKGLLLQVENTSNGAWETVSESAFDDDARVAVFRIEDWDSSREHAARVRYEWNGEPHDWYMLIRKEPGMDDAVALAAFSCDAGYAFPLTPLVTQVKAQDPDLVFFAGDQIYEHVGGFGVGRDQPEDFTLIDYLRKYYLFGWTWREVLRDRPSVIIPDDHDVFHGNIWGAGGQLLEIEQRPVQGGYWMSPRFVNAVQRTQTAHLPSPYDPTPVLNNISVYYTNFKYGPIDIAVIEDRKWKDGPAHVTGGIYDPANLQNVRLLGERQEKFLEHWVSQASPFKVVLSQTMFAKPATHTGWNMNESLRDPDCNGWPSPARDRAVNLLGPDVVHIAGDQHLGMLAKMGTAGWDEGPMTLMVPGTANGHPRAWWPATDVDGNDSSAQGYLGRYVEGLGNRIEVFGVANPQKGSHKLRPGGTPAYEVARQRGSGYGIAHFEPTTNTVDFKLLRFPEMNSDYEQADLFDGFPVEWQVKN